MPCNIHCFPYQVTWPPFFGGQKFGLLDLQHLCHAFTPFLNGLQEFSHKEPVWTHPGAVRLCSRDRSWRRDRGGQSFRQTATFRTSSAAKPRAEVSPPASSDVWTCSFRSLSSRLQLSSPRRRTDPFRGKHGNGAALYTILPTPHHTHTHTCTFSQTHRRS